MNPLLGGLLGSVAGNYLMNKDNEEGTVWDKLGFSGANAQSPEQMTDPGVQIGGQPHVNMPVTPQQSVQQPTPPVEEPGFMSKMGDGISDFWNDEAKMANLAIGLNSMRLNPDANLAKAMQTKIDRLQKNKGRNATVVKLREMNRNDLADAVESGSMKATDAWKVAFEGEDTKTIQNLKWRASQAGLEEGTEAYKNFMLNAGSDRGMNLTVDKDGKITFSQGGGTGSTRALTEGEGKATGFYNRAITSNKQLLSLEQSGTGFMDAMLGKIPIVGNYLISDEYRQYDQAQRNFVNAILRQESGAAIGPDEFSNANLQYFPQPGDDTTTIAMKRQNRVEVQEALAVSSGKGLQVLKEHQDRLRGGNSKPSVSEEDKANLPIASTLQQLDALKTGDKYVDSMGNIMTKSW
jgi:hypothetical protein